MSDDDRFWKRVEKTDFCWEYMGSRNPCGYGWVTRNHKQMNAQRWAWILIHGPIPHGMHVLHTCDNPACVNPDHLYLGSHQDNMLDRAQRRRVKTQKLSVKDVLAIRDLRMNGATCQEIANKFHISNGHASAVSRRLHHARD